MSLALTATPAARGGQAPLLAATLAGVLAWALVAAALQAAGAPQVWLLLVLAPLLEEAAFRAGLHEALLRRPLPPWLANAAVALVFALLHAAVQGRWEAMAVALPALLIGAAYQRWRRVRWCVLLHAAMNAVWLAMTLMNRAA